MARLPIDRAFTVRGFGTIATGTLVSGRIATDDGLDLLPAGRRVRVRGLQVHGQSCRQAAAAQRVAVNLSGVQVRDLARGDALVEPGGFVATRRADTVLSLLDGARSLKHGARVRFHAGTSETMARISLAAPTVGGEDADPLQRLEPGAEAFARVRLEKPVTLTRGDRFVLRTYSPLVTIAGGRVLDPSPGRGRLRTRAGRERLCRLDGPDPGDQIAAMAAAAGARGVAVEQLPARAGLTPPEVSTAIAALADKGRVVLVGSSLLAPETEAALRDTLRGWVAAHHERRPLEPGLPREEARERFGRRSSSEIFVALVQRMVADGTLTAGEHLVLAGRKVVLSSEERRVADLIAATLGEAGLTPPEPAAVAQESHFDPGVASRMTTYLVRSGVLVRLDAQHFHASALARLKADIAQRKRAHAGERLAIDVATFKDWYRVSRKHAIPLLGYLDRERVTRRVGDVRVVL